MSGRARPFGPALLVGESSPDMRVAVEDQLLEPLAPRGCRLRPPLPWWKLFAGDMHHRIDLHFNEAGVLLAGRNVPRKGPQTEALPPEVLHEIDGRIEAWLIAAVAARVRFNPAPVGSISVYLPLCLDAE